MNRYQIISLPVLVCIGLLIISLPGYGYVLEPFNWLYLGGSPVTVNMYVNPNCSDPTAPDELASLQSAMNTWSTAGANFAFNYAGYTGVTNFTYYNFQNDMCWNSGSSGGALATTSIWYSGGNILQTDVVFWDGPWTWNTSWPSWNQFDVESVGLHELGHVVGLDHSQYSWAVMWYAISWGEVQRDLSSDDVNGIIAIYGTSGGPSLTVTLTPTGTVTVPSYGGSIPYDLTCHNNTGSTVYFDGWSVFEQQGGPYSQQVIFRPNIWVGGGNTIARSLSLTISGSVPNGTYHYYLRAGDYYAPSIIDEDYFVFYKNADDGVGPWVWQTSDDALDGVGIALEWVVPETFHVGAAYPNPFNPETTISFDLPEASHVSLVIYNLRGQKVADVLNGSFDAGHYSATWNAAGYPSGTYVYRFSSDLGQATGKMVLMK